MRELGPTSTERVTEYYNLILCITEKKTLTFWLQVKESINLFKKLIVLCIKNFHAFRWNFLFKI